MEANSKHYEAGGYVSPRGVLELSAMSDANAVHLDMIGVCAGVVRKVAGGRSIGTTCVMSLCTRRPQYIREPIILWILFDGAAKCAGCVECRVGAQCTVRRLVPLDCIRT